MRKRLSVLICCICITACVLMSGCSGVFGGRFFYLVSSEATSYLNQVSSSSIDWSTGKSVKIIVQGDGINTNVDYWCIASLFDPQILLAKGTMVSTVKTRTEVVNTWYDGVYEYNMHSFSGNVVKTKEMGSASAYLSLLSQVDTIVKEYLNLVVNKGSNIQYSVNEANTEQIKLRLHIPTRTNDIQGTLIFVFDGQGTIVACNINLNVWESGDLTKTQVIIQPWSGAINLPLDTNSFVEK